MSERFVAWLEAPQPVLRLELVRILGPLAILALLGARLAHPSAWLGPDSFRLDGVVGAEALATPSLPAAGALALALAIIASGGMVTLGLWTDRAAAVFGSALVYAALADPLSASAGSRLAPAIAFALALSPAGSSLSLDARFGLRRAGTTYSAGAVRFLQALVAVFYSGAGACKVHGDWLLRGDVVRAQLLAFPLGRVLAGLALGPAWTALQALIVLVQIGAPVWLAWPKTRPSAVGLLVAFELANVIVFPPLRGLATLAIVLLLAGFLPSATLMAWGRRART
jgi:hypothetical protein